MYQNISPRTQLQYLYCLKERRRISGAWTGKPDHHNFPAFLVPLLVVDADVDVFWSSMDSFAFDQAHWQSILYILFLADKLTKERARLPFSPSLILTLIDVIYKTHTLARSNFSSTILVEGIEFVHYTNSRDFFGWGWGILQGRTWWHPKKVVAALNSIPNLWFPFHSEKKFSFVPEAEAESA